ncbi:MAG: hypothetical protein CMJ36_00980 [Phycisphaerae bacterium]|nr:hypothetical protein [Phycisphaerae bacterium]
MGGSALAAVVNGDHGLDRWAGEHSWQIASSGGSLVASMYVSGSLLYGGVSNISFVSNTASSHFGNVYFNMDLAAGTYTVSMQDSYGDGWNWNSYQGGLTISGSAVSGGVASGTVTGSSASFSFTVLPAPGAMALLGLAGLAGRRRRRA